MRNFTFSPDEVSKQYEPIKKDWKAIEEALKSFCTSKSSYHAIGPDLLCRIDYRRLDGKFRSVDYVMNVKEITEFYEVSKYFLGTEVSFSFSPWGKEFDNLAQRTLSSVKRHFKINP